MKTLAQEIKDATDDKVNAARLQLRTLVDRLDAELNKFEVPAHSAAIAELQIRMNFRQQIMNDALIEEDRRNKLAQVEVDTKRRAAAFEAAQTAQKQKPETINV